MKQEEIPRDRTAAEVPQGGPFDHLLHHVDHGVVLTDLEERSLIWNPAALAMHGFADATECPSYREFISLFELHYPDGSAVPADQRPLRRILRGERLRGLELRAERRGGGWQRIFSYGGALIAEAGGQPPMALMTVTDVTERRRLEQELRLRTEELQTLMDVAPVAIFVATDPACDKIVANPTGNAFTEAEAGENISENRRNLRRHFCNGRELHASELPMQQAGARNIHVRNAEIDVMMPSGRRVSMFGSASPLHDHDGRVRGVVGAFVDITTRKQGEEALRASERQLRTVLDNLFTFVAVLTPDGVVREINRAPLEAAGIGANDVLGKKFTECAWWTHSREAQQRVQDAIDRGLYGEVSRFDVEIRVVGDRRITIDFMLAPLRDANGHITHLLPSAVDVTARKETERALLHKTEELSRINSELEAFSYSVSHDLRSPLRAINGYGGILREEYGHLLPAEAGEFLGRMHEATVRMGELIDGLLNLSRVIRSEVRLSQIDLSRSVAKIADALRESEPGRQVTFQVEPGVVVYGDPSLLHVLLENLIGNAWKFTSSSERARIEFGRIMLDGQTVCFLRDNGVGFDMQFAHKLFQPFERLHKHGEFAGTGIGLATVRRIVERHGGRVWAESGLGSGTTIYFSLADAEAASPLAVAPHWGAG